MWRRQYGSIASLLIFIFLLHFVGGGSSDPYSYDVDVPVGAKKKDPAQAKKKELHMQKIGTVDQHDAIYKMKRIRCDWDGDGQLNRPEWAGAMRTQTTKQKPALESSGGDLTNTQMMAEGIVVPMHAPCRPDPKKPWNGFATGANTEMNRGLIIPFELGGMNSRANIVPMKKGWAEDGGGWQSMTEAIVKYVSEIYGWKRPPKDYEVYSLNTKDKWDESAEFETPDILMKMVVDLNPDWSDGYNKDNNLDEDGAPIAYEIRLVPEPKEGNECLLRRIDIEAGQNPEYFAWSGESWQSLAVGDLGDPYVDNVKASVKTAKSEEELADMIAAGMKANGFLNSYSALSDNSRRFLKVGTGRFCGAEGRNCKCDPKIKGPDGTGGKACDAKDTEGYAFCYVKPGACKDGKPSAKMKDWHYSRLACKKPKPDKKKAEEAKKKKEKLKKKKVEPKCVCDGTTDDNGNGGSDCKTVLYGTPWCYTKKDVCSDGKASKHLKTHDWSEKACKNSKTAMAILEKKLHKEVCKCAGVQDKAKHGGADCKSVWEEKPWCYVHKGSCEDGTVSKVMKAYDFSHDACVPGKILAAAKTTCKCDGMKDRRGAGGPDCKSVWEEKSWCFVKKGACRDGQKSKTHPMYQTSNLACEYEKARQALTTTTPPAPKEKTEMPTFSPTRKIKPIKKIPGKDDNCECDGIEDQDNNGGDDCVSKFDNKAWCYVKEKVCSDGRQSNTLKSHDWSFIACLGHAPEDDIDECEKHKNGNCPPGCLQGPKDNCINGKGKKDKKGKKEAMVMSSLTLFQSTPYFVFTSMILLLAFLTFTWRSRQRKEPARQALLLATTQI